MVISHLPDKIYPLRIRAAQQLFSGHLYLQDMPRLLPLITDSQGDVEVKLELGHDEQGLSYIKGHISALVHQVCQRCLEPMELPLQIDIALSPVVSDKIVLPEPYEPLVASDAPMQIKTLIEDELLLNLPMVAKHTVCL